MQNQSTLYGIIGFLAGALLTVLLASNAVNGNNTGMMRMMGMRMDEDMMEEKEEMMGDHETGMDMSMTDMMQSLQGKTADDFDRAFITAMIDHHQGAIDMANEAKKNAKHEEIKNLADDIIKAQTSEIDTMKKWQEDWNYAN